MSISGTRTDPLHAVQRLQELELDQARTEQTCLEQAVEQQRRKISTVEAVLDEGRTLELTLMANANGVPVEALRQIRLYVRAQAQDLLHQQEILAQAEAAAANALLSVIGNFQRLSATRRLRERRAAETATQQMRVRFKQWDDLALVTKCKMSRS